MTDTIAQLAPQMAALFRQAIQAANVAVNDIIQCGEQDTAYIDHQLDHMLGLCCDANMLLVFKRLCRCYFSIDPVATGEHIDAYREMWDMPDEVVPERGV